jgi:fatty-acyl-CoA synthase
MDMSMRIRRGRLDVMTEDREGTSMWINVTTIGDLVDQQAGATARDAVVFPGARVTYPELRDLTDRWARALVALGVGPREKVGILSPNRLEYVAALIAIAKLGAVAVPINGRFKTHELTHVVSHADLRVLIVASDPAGTDYLELVRSVFPTLDEQDAMALALPEAPLLRQIVSLDGARPGLLGGAAFLAGADAVDVEAVKAYQRRVRVRDVALLMYTSGTTARPKGCLLTHEAVVRQATAVARTRFLLTADDAFWDPLPLFHCGGIVPMLGCFTVGAKYVHAGHFEPGQALRALEQERCTVGYPAFETIWNAVLNHPDFEQADLSRLRLLQNICTPERLAQYEARMPWAVQVSSYGSTECATNLTLPLPGDPYDVRMNTLGTPVEGMEIKIVDPETGDERPAGVVGELCFRGYSQFEGYYKDPEQTAATIDAGGWFHTGDLGKVDDGGRLSYAGRLKDMLKVGGENVAAIEIEDFLARHPAIDIVQVVGAPDARYLEVPAAFVQVKPGADVTAEEVIAFAVGEIASYKVPRYVRFVSEWPMSGTKIQKFVLRDRIERELDGLGLTEAPRIGAS